ncbi:hypothetical protein CVIRNUC_000331 [Coccomyxa viridis]|uniref:DUF1232 domain-containing protein n=1 Tax=Coccomyxa viridis TaxID=1274662 RepID=A0AAV1HQQ8_9CHLO|nr:hypothetical protein CVIRNUC_000331 [Coccomyxa viridis]
MNKRKELNRWNKLLISIAIDLVGLSDFIVPGAAQIADIGWAPLSALIVQHLYHNKYLTTINFIEEVLPFTDVIPTATIGWFMEYTRGGKHIKKEVDDKVSN